VNVISGNTAPEERVVTTELKENYVNRIFITLQGRKATDLEFNEAKQLLGEEALILDRIALVSNVFNSDLYYTKLYEDARADYLDGLDTNQIQQDYLVYVNLLNSVSPDLKEILEVEIARLEQLLEIETMLKSGDIGTTDLHKRMVDNLYYDEINMGTENFVVATFQNFLFRYPTDDELENSSLMIEGSNGVLFLKAGFSKKDFIDIFFSSQSYFEGQVLTLFRKHLFRDPNTAEMFDKTILYASEKGYQDLQRELLTSDEYFFNEF
jgi:hypothetical protein